MKCSIPLKAKPWWKKLILRKFEPEEDSFEEEVHWLWFLVLQEGGFLGVSHR